MLTKGEVITLHKYTNYLKPRSFISLSKLIWFFRKLIKLFETGAGAFRFFRSDFNKILKR